MNGVVYKILSRLDNKIYIGSTINYTSRKYHHLFCLRNKKHRNNYLQRAFERHGEENFIFEVLEKDILQEN